MSTHHPLVPPEEKHAHRQEKVMARLYTRKDLQLETAELTRRVTTWLLEGDRLERMLVETKLKDVMVTLGIATDKMLALEGQPLANVGTPQQAKLDQLSGALAAVLQQRGLGTVTVTERKVELKETEAR